MLQESNVLSELQGRRDWVKPAIKRLDAGSAELDVGPNDDGIDLS